MTPERVRQLIEAYGAHPGRWPAAERDAALRLMTEHPGLVAAAREAEALDALLDRADRAAPPAWLTGRIAARLTARRPGAFWREIWPFRAVWQPAAALAASLAIGLWLGAAGLAPAPLARSATDMAQSGTQVEMALALYGLTATVAEDLGDDG